MKRIKIKHNFIFAILLLFLILNISAIHEDIESYNQELSVFASKSIEQRAIDISKQIEIYINAHPELKLEDLKNDNNFRNIAVQQVGETGYIIPNSQKTRKHDPFQRQRLRYRN